MCLDCLLKTFKLARALSKRSIQIFATPFYIPSRKNFSQEIALSFSRRINGAKIRRYQFLVVVKKYNADKVEDGYALYIQISTCTFFSFTHAKIYECRTVLLSFARPQKFFIIYEVM